MSRLVFVIACAFIGLLAAFATKKFSAPDQTPKVVEIKQSTDNPVPRRTDSYAPAVRKASPAVVNIHSREPSKSPTNNGNNTAEIRNLGSGVIVSPQGYVLTNHHVIANAGAIFVSLTDGRQANASVVGTDVESDLAVLKINIRNLPTIVLGKSAQLEVGDVVLAIGNPFGFGNTVTQGIVSATGRNQLGLNTFENFIQTDAAINPGNSGGALINASGHLIGINSAIISRSGGSQGIGFAIPVDFAKGILKSLILHGRVIRGWVGIEARELTAQEKERFLPKNTQGILVTGVYVDSPADVGDVSPGDILLSIDDMNAISIYDILLYVTSKHPGDEMNVSVLRQGKKLERTLKITERPVPNRR